LKSTNGNTEVVRLFPEAANQNERGLAVSWAVSLGEGAHAGDRSAMVPPPPFQAVDSTMRGYLQALAPDPMLPMLTVL
jgi:hypothetical protein